MGSCALFGKELIECFGIEPDKAFQTAKEMFLGVYKVATPLEVEANPGCSAEVFLLKCKQYGIVAEKMNCD